jgi:hypothetical protein
MVDNFLQLSDSGMEQPQILLASIDQKQTLCNRYHFGNAINFKSNSKYLPFAIVPILLLVSMYPEQCCNSQSLNRVVILTISFASHLFKFAQWQFTNGTEQRFHPD